MYCKFYGLKEKPFNVTSDPAFFFLSNKHKEALAHLHYGVSQRKGIIVLTGEIAVFRVHITYFRNPPFSIFPISVVLKSRLSSSPDFLRIPFGQKAFLHIRVS